MENSGRKTKFVAAVLVVTILIIVLSAVVCSARGIIITLENTGPSPITDAGLGFGLKWPGKFAVDIRDFQIGVIPISMDHPLLPGETACVGPVSRLSARYYLQYAGIQSSGDGYVENFPSPLHLVPNVSTVPLDYAVSGVQGGRIAGVFRFFSSVPDSCKTGYALPFGSIIINNGAALTTSTSIDLSISCYATVGYTCKNMQFSNDNISWSAPEPYAKDKTWTLLPGDGEKTVYVRFEDNIGNWSDAYGETIIFRAPTLTQIRSFPIPTFPDPGSSVSKLAFGDGKLFTINHFYDRPCPCPTESEKAKIYVLDPANGNILNSFSVPTGISDLASDGVNLYVNMYNPIAGDILKLDSTTGSILGTIHPAGVSINSFNSFIDGLSYINGEIFQSISTDNCGLHNVVRLNASDGSYVGCFDVSSLGISLLGWRELDSAGTNWLYGGWVRDARNRGTSFWTVFTLSTSSTLLKSDIILSAQGEVPYVFEAWGDNQLFVADKRSNRILVFQLASAIRAVPANLNFGQTIIGETSKPQPVTIYNTGSANLSIKAVEISGADAGMFSVAMGGPSPCSSLTPTIAPGEKCTVGVTFSPVSMLEKTAVLSISSGATGENPVVNVALVGTGAITPNGGEIIPSGSTYAIQWGAPSDAVKFDLKYSINNGSTWRTIASKVTGTSYDWHVPIPSNNIASCLVRVIGFNSSGTKVGEYVSSFPFTMEVVKVVSPQNGETLKSGDIRTITWQTNGTVKPVTSVKLSYSTDGGISWITMKTLKSNTGTYDWIVPTVSNLSTGCKVKVVLKSAGETTVGNAVSSGVFTIHP